MDRHVDQSNRIESPGKKKKGWRVLKETHTFSIRVSRVFNRERIISSANDPERTGDPHVKEGSCTFISHHI